MLAQATAGDARTPEASLDDQKQPRSKQVLMVAYYFPPVAWSGSMRPLGFVRHLASNGWSPSVLSADPKSVVPAPPLDAELEARVPAGVEVLRVGHIDLTHALVRLRDLFRNARPERSPTRQPSGKLTTVSRWKPVLESLVQHVCAVPDRQRMWLARAARVSVSSRPDLVYATGGPWTALLVGEALARRFRVPFVADFRDPWTRNPSRKMSRFMAWRSKRLERMVCRRATYVIANTQESREQFVSDYPDMAHKFITVTNGFDSLPDVSFGDYQHPREGGPMEVVHFGSVYGSRTPTNLLMALERLHASNDLTAGRLHVRFIGAWEVTDKTCNAVADRLEAVGLLSREPAMPHRACLRRMCEADVLLVLQEGFPLQIPGKIYEYVATRRPLWLIGDDGATASLVKRHGLGIHSRDRVCDIEEVLKRVAGDPTIEARRSPDVDSFSYAELTRRLVHVFDQALGDPALQGAEADLRSEVACVWHSRSL